MKNQLKDINSDEDFKEFNSFWKKCLEMSDRRERARKQVVPCPECGTDQVQMTDWYTNVLKMKCRRCKHKFERKLK